VFRLLQPTRFGGYEADPVTFYTDPADRGACGSTAGGLVIGVHPWQLVVPAQAQDDVWGHDPHTRMSSSTRRPLRRCWWTRLPAVRAVELLLGLRRNGQLVRSGHRDRREEPGRLQDLPAAVGRHTIDDVWEPSGCAHRSNDIVVTNVFVPRTLAELLDTRAAAAGQRPTRPAVRRRRLVFSYTITTPNHRHGHRRVRAHLSTPATGSGSPTATGRRRPVRPGPIGEAASDIDAPGCSWAPHDRADAPGQGGENIPMPLRLGDPARPVRGLGGPSRRGQAVRESAGGRCALGPRSSGSGGRARRAVHASTTERALACTAPGSSASRCRTDGCEMTRDDQRRPVRRGRARPALHYHQAGEQQGPRWCCCRATGRSAWTKLGRNLPVFAETLRTVAPDQPVRRSGAPVRAGTTSHTAPTRSPGCWTRSASSGRIW